MEVEPPIAINGTTYLANVAAILKVEQTLTNDMGIRQHAPPDHYDYVVYPTKCVVWTRFQGWFLAMRVQREAFVVAPWEVNNSVNSAHIAYGMANAYCVVAKWNNEIDNISCKWRLQE